MGKGHQVVTDEAAFCECRCHHTVDPEATVDVLRRDTTPVELVHPVETALACPSCYAWHQRARRRPRGLQA